MFSACRTLDWLLERFHKTSYKKNRTLSLGTDIDLTINNMLLASFCFKTFIQCRMSYSFDIDFGTYLVLLYSKQVFLFSFFLTE